MLRKMLESLKRKYGPLPLWAWAAIAGGGLALWYRMRRPSSDTGAAAIAEPAYAFGAEPDYGDTGPSAPGDPGVGGLPVASEDVPVDYYPDNKLRGAAMELIDQIRGITDEVEAAGGGAGAGYEEVVEPDAPADVGERAPAQPERGVRWGGRLFKTKAALGAHLAKHYAGRGQARRAYDQWAKNHPGAAAKLAGPKPKPPKKDKPKAAKQPSSRSNREPAKGGRGAAGARARKPQPPAPKAKPARPRAPVTRRQAPKPAPPKRKKAGRRR